MNENEKLNKTIKYAVEITIRLGFLLLLVAWCFRILYPFTGVILWGIILAVALAPAYDAINNKIGNKPKLASAILVLTGLLILVLPGFLFFDSMIEGAKIFKERIDKGLFTIPPPTDMVSDWPLIGNKVYDAWKLASENMESIVVKYQEPITRIAETIFKGIISAGGSLIQFILSIFIAGILLITKGTDQTTRKFFKKLVGDNADEFTNITIKTVGNVTKGVLGVALIQSILVGLGLLLAGVPYAGIWALLVLILAILQLPAIIVTLPVMIYLFSTFNLIPAVLWSIYLFIAGISDNILKPILLGKGAPVPMVIIFLGVIGGFMLSGFIGLFTGAIVLSLGYKLFETWLNTGDKKENFLKTDTQSGP